MGWPGNTWVKRQLKISQPLVLLNNGGAGESPALVLPTWTVMTPDSRLRTKVTLLFSATPPYTLPEDLTGLGATLWLYESEQDYGGGNAGLVPSVALDGSTLLVPIAIPKSVGLAGYSREFVTAGDAIQGQIKIATPAGFIGKIVLQARWQPDGQRLPADEWEEIETLCSMVGSQVTGP